MSTIEVRFIFPNHDGVNVFLTASKKMRGLQLKDHLIENWPSGKLLLCVKIVSPILTHVSNLTYSSGAMQWHRQNTPHLYGNRNYQRRRRVRSVGLFLLLKIYLQFTGVTVRITPWTGSKFPIFADHPTPVNVSIRPVTASDVLRKGIAVPSKQKSETSSHSSPRDDVLQDRLIDCNEVDDADVPTERSSSSGSCNCCIIV